MGDVASDGPRTEKQLVRAARAFASESVARSWWHVGSTFVVLIAVLAVAALAPWWPARLAASLLGGLLLVRAFVLFHDFYHGAILRKSRLAKALFFTYGLIVLCPARVWRHTHNYHHAHVAKPLDPGKGNSLLFTSDVGTFPLMTTAMWRQAKFGQRLAYRIARHPLTILAAYLSVFLYSMCLRSLLENPKVYWTSIVSLVVHVGLCAAVWIFAGPLGWLFACLLPFTIASAMGAYLFYVQHNFEGAQIRPREEWSFPRAALEASSYMKLGRVMNFFTANIGYHHVHHLCSRIPFYRLPEAMAAIPETREPGVTTLRLRDIFRCLRLNLWDLDRRRLVPYRAAAGAA